jgi:hypothetical protein
VGTPIARDGLLYVGDLGGTIHCLDAATGAHVWKHDTNEAIWGSLLLAGDRLYVGNVEGSMTVLRAGRRKQVLGQIEMDAPLYSPPALIGDALYLATANRLYLIARAAVERSHNHVPDASVSSDYSSSCFEAGCRRPPAARGSFSANTRRLRDTHTARALPPDEPSDADHSHSR